MHTAKLKTGHALGCHLIAVLIVLFNLQCLRLAQINVHLHRHFLLRRDPHRLARLLLLLLGNGAKVKFVHCHGLLRLLLVVLLDVLESSHLWNRGHLLMVLILGLLYFHAVFIALEIFPVTL